MLRTSSRKRALQPWNRKQFFKTSKYMCLQPQPVTSSPSVLICMQPQGTECSIWPFRLESFSVSEPTHHGSYGSLKYINPLGLLLPKSTLCHPTGALPAAARLNHALPTPYLPCPAAARLKHALPTPYVPCPAAARLNHAAFPMQPAQGSHLSTFLRIVGGKDLSTWSSAVCSVW